MAKKMDDRSGTSKEGSTEQGTSDITNNEVDKNRTRSVLGELGMGAVLLFCLGCMGLISYGFFHLRVTVNKRENPCEMTYMRPHYYPVPMANHSRLAYKYRLFRYSHEELTDLEAQQGLQSGNILLFIPGSMGSYGQVRSIGKELIVHSDAETSGRAKVAIFTLDLGEEASGLSGLLLQQHVEFARDSLQRILNLHAQAAGDQQGTLAAGDQQGALAARDQQGAKARVVLFAHSMGGIAGRALLGELDTAADDANASLETSALAKSITALISLSSPHLSPPVGADAILHKIYEEIRGHSDKQRLYLSLAGGYRDTLVSSTLAFLDKEQYPKSASALTASVTDGGVSTDHQAILWCSQVMVPLARDLVALFEHGASPDKLQLFAKMTQKRIPAAGFTRKAFEEYFAPKASLNSKDQLLAFVADTVSRQHALLTFQLVFAAGVLLLVSGPPDGLSPAQALGLLGFWACAWLAIISEAVLAWVPIILLLGGAGSVLLIAFLAGSVFRGLKLIMPILQLASFAVTLWWPNVAFNYQPWASHYLAAFYIMIMANLVTSALAACAQTPYDFYALIFLSGPWKASQFELAAGLLFLPALAAWVSPTVQALTMLKAPLTMADTFPIAPHRGSRGVYHPVAQTDLPAYFFHENGTRVEPPSDDLEQSSWLFFSEDSQYSEAVSSQEAWFLIVSALCALPVIVFLSDLAYNPIEACEEKVLDSNYQRMRPKRPATDTKNAASKPSTLRKRAKQKKSSETGEVEASQDAKGALKFRDTTYAPNNEPMIVVFANGEEIQLDELETLDPLVDKLPDAPPLIGDGSANVDLVGTSVVLIQRIRSGTKAFPDSKLLRVLLLVIAFACSLPGKDYLFLMQYGASASAMLCLAFRSRQKPRERYVHKKVG